MLRRILPWCVLLLFFLIPSNTKAQEFEIQRFDVNVQLQPSSNSAQIQAKLGVINITTQGRSGPFINLKLNKRAKITGIQVDGTTVEIKQKNDERLTELINVSIDFPKPVAPNATATINLNYALEIKESSSINAIVPGTTVLLPESFWVPFIHTPFLITYGVDVAPTNIQINAVEGERPQSDGSRRSSGNVINFEQTLAAQPILLSGNYDDPVEIKGRNTTTEFVYARGLSNARKQAEAISSEIDKIVDFYNQLLGTSLPKNFRIISSAQVASYVTGTTIILGEDIFRRDTLDIETIEFLSRALLRNKIAGENISRGKGWAILQDALPVYLAGLYFEKSYGAVGGQEFFARRIRAYAPVAATKNDGALLGISQLDNTYASSMLNKAPLLFKIIEGQIGREKMLSILKDLLNSKNHVLRFEDFRKSITTNKSLELFFDQWFEKIIDPDFVIGIPVATEGGWSCALRNLGTGNVEVKVLAITEKGEKLYQMVSLPSQGRAEALFKTPEKLKYVEVDPDKFFPQTNYDNDSRPAKTSTFTLFKDANVLFNKRSYEEAEAKIKEALEQEPNNIVTRTLLARTFLAESKFSEAKTETDTILKSAPLPTYSITWVNYVLGALALNQKNTKEAIDYLRRAIAVSKDNIFIRNKLIEIEKASNQLPATEESVRNFITQLDKGIKEATFQALEPVIVRANLNKFAKGLVGNKPESWSTEVLRTEVISSDKVAVDVIVTAVDINKREQSGEALYILRRSGSSWVLNNVEFFNIQ